MSDRSAIEWTEATWNPVTGCTEVSEGCDHCYAKTFAERWRGIPGHAYEQGFDLKLWPGRLDIPLRWKRPRRVFVNSMSDLFQDGVPDEFIREVFAVMAGTPRHTYQVLTKRPGRMASFLRLWRELAVRPLPNVWLGTSVETQKWADVRIPQLLRAPAAVRFLSCEPLLGPLNLAGAGHLDVKDSGATIDWVIAGGESGPGARPMDPVWVRSLRGQCAAAGLAFFFKQWGGRTPKAGGRELDGRTWDEMPLKRAEQSLFAEAVPLAAAR
jgi:protein gp37